MEKFKDIPNYEGIYQVSNLGNVKSLKYNKEIILSSGFNKGGYLVVVLRKNNNVKTFYVHTLVATTFLKHNSDGYKLIVDHIDNDKSNNRLDNLQLTTQRKNISKDRKNKTSKYTGVHWSKSANKWTSQIRIKGKAKHLGLFINEYDAHLTYQKEVKDLFNK